MKKIVLLALVSLSCLVTSGHARAEDLTLASSVLWNGFWGIEVVGDYVFSIGPGGLRIINVSNPDSLVLESQLMLQQLPLPEGSYNFNRASFGIAVRGDLVFAVNFNANGNGMLYVIDVSDVSFPFVVGSHLCTNYASDVDVSGDYVYVAETYSGLVVYYVGNPSSPVEVGHCHTTYALGVAVLGNYAYIADGTKGLKKINISDPTHPIMVDSCDTPDYASKVCVRDNVAYVADDRSDGPTRAGLQIIDLSTFTIIGSLDMPLHAAAVGIGGDYCYVVDEYWGVSIVSIANPAAPRLVASYDGVPNTSFASCVAFLNDLIYVGDAMGGGLEIINVINPSAPFLVGLYEDPGIILSVATQGSYAYVCAGLGGFVVVSMANPYCPIEVGSCNTPGQATYVAVAGDYAYVADQDSIIQIVDIGDPLHPTIVSDIQISGYQPSAYGVTVLGDYIYVGMTWQGLQIFNVSNPLQPTWVGGFDTPAPAGRLAVAGDYAYVTYRGSSNGLRIVNISDPSNPTFVCDYVTPSPAHAVAVDGDYAYLGGHDFGLLIINVTDPSSPVLEGSYEYDYDIRGITVSGNRVHVADSRYGIMILDVTIPSAPVLLDSIATRGQSFDVAVMGEFVIVANYYSLLVFSHGDDYICDYLPGDINGDGQRVGGDIIYGVNYFKGTGAPPPDSCYNDSVNTPSHYLHVAGDANGDCMFGGPDITYLVRYFKGFVPIRHCHLFPPSFRKKPPFIVPQKQN